MADALSLSPGANCMIVPGLPPALLLAQAAGGVSSLAPFALQFILIIAIIYFIMVRPQQRQRKQHETALAALKRGDEVVTAGGIVGEVVHIRETSKDGGANRMDDRVTIKSGESRIVVERGRIARINGASATSAAASNTTTPS